MTTEEVIADIIAAAFHATYEQLAPNFGYETKLESRKSWGEVPEQNRALMRATVQRLLDDGLISTVKGRPLTLDEERIGIVEDKAL